MYEAVSQNNNFEKITAIFNKYEGQKRVILTGHSLGFGLSQILALKMLEEKGELSKHIVSHSNGNLQEGDPKLEEMNFLQYMKEKKSFTLEIVGFGGPAVMTQPLATELKESLERFNDYTLKGHSIINYVHYRDAVAYEGKKLLDWVKTNFVAKDGRKWKPVYWFGGFKNFVKQNLLTENTDTKENTDKKEKTFWLQKQMVRKALKKFTNDGKAIPSMAPRHVTSPVFVDMSKWRGLWDNVKTSVLSGTGVNSHKEYFDMVSASDFLEEWLKEENASV